MAPTPKKSNALKNSASTSSPMSANSTSASKKIHPNAPTTTTTATIAPHHTPLTRPTASNPPPRPLHPRPLHLASLALHLQQIIATSMRSITVEVKIHTPRTGAIRAMWRTTTTMRSRHSSKLVSREGRHRDHRPRSLHLHLRRVGVRLMGVSML